MIGPPNEDDNFSSFYVTWHHVLTIFSFSNFFWSSWRELWTLIVPNITRQITLRPNYLPVECATAILRGFFLDSNFVYTLKEPARNRTENWEPDVSSRECWVCWACEGPQSVCTQFQISKQEKTKIYEWRKKDSWISLTVRFLREWVKNMLF